MKEGITLNIKLNNRLLPGFLLLLVAFIWGSGFVITDSVVKAGIPPSMLVTLRFFIPSVIMAVIFRKELAEGDIKEYLYSCGAGVLLFLAFVSQTYGISYTTPANNAFLTATNVIMVPFLSLVLFRQKLDLKSVICAFTCFAGAAILSWSPGVGITFNIGDWLTLLCALLFALHFAYLGNSASICKHTGLLCCIQLFSTSVFAFIFFLFTDLDKFSLPMLTENIWGILYLALFSTGFCYFVQTWAQKRFSPSGTAIILSMEGFFGSCFSVAAGRDDATVTFVVGGAIILLSVIAVQLESDFIKKLLAAGRK